jgi:FAD:protein FMN transferase
MATESDALPTAAMVLPEPELTEVLAAETTWHVLVEDDGRIRTVGSRPVAPKD